MTARLATPKAVVFDLDGTLVDTAPDLGATLNRLLAAMIGDGTPKFVERGFEATGGVPGELAPLVHRFLTLYEGALVDTSRPYPGTEAMLAALAGQGVRLAVCTNKPSTHTALLLQTLGLDHWFQAVVGGDVPNRKPHPDHLLRTLRLLGVDAASAVMVGDSENDVAAARAAGLPVVVVSFGYSRLPAAELGGDALISHMDELPPLLGLA